MLLDAELQLKAVRAYEERLFYMVSNPSQDVEGVGLSIYPNLTAKIQVKLRQNGEGQVITLKTGFTKSTHLPKNTPPKRKKGQIIQKGLTSKGKGTIRVISDCYNEMILNDDSGDYDKFCRFITLSYRNLIPTHSEAKKMLDSFLKRLRRKVGDNVHYVWVAELQKRGAIHFHILTPERIVRDKEGSKQRIAENIWINRAWNEVVGNWALNKAFISMEERKMWQQEYSLSEAYYIAKDKYKIAEYKFLDGGRKTKPREPKKPSKSKFLLLPNCVHVLHAGRYMAKYMSKEGQNIAGNLYNASQKSREFLKNEIIDIGVANIDVAHQVLELIRQKKHVDKSYSYDFDVKGTQIVGTWFEDAGKLKEYVAGAMQDIEENIIEYESLFCE